MANVETSTAPLLHPTFTTRRFTTTLDGQEVSCRIFENAAVDSSCTELWSGVERSTRKWEPPCPQTVVLGGVRRTSYLDNSNSQPPKS